ncbi:helix-turn-helix domain-containing protein [Streptomyces sp. NBC_01262]|uniref:helix-turn-helix domain-containing protein n=1 Tax=Streptomyces sp. NBC_01262 TaxID=2903803 RepID=UPI002E32225E|nr:helix-turn-helix transcriptional regulator [Streptomyces sp. NBC_01262]
MPRDPLPNWIIESRRAIGVRIQALRIQANLRQPQFAERASIDLRQLQRIEAGTADLRFHELALISEALGVSVAELVTD